MIFLKSQINELDLAKAEYLEASRQDRKNERRAKRECKRLLISPKGLSAIAGLGVLKGTLGKPISTKQAGMLFGRRILSAWLGGSAANASEEGQEVQSGLTEIE